MPKTYLFPLINAAFGSLWPTFCTTVGYNDPEAAPGLSEFLNKQSPFFFHQVWDCTFYSVFSVFESVCVFGSWQSSLPWKNIPLEKWTLNMYSIISCYCNIYSINLSGSWNETTWRTEKKGKQKPILDITVRVIVETIRTKLFQCVCGIADKLGCVLFKQIAIKQHDPR